jgi:phosphatidylglycerophosphate synthase
MINRVDFISISILFGTAIVLVVAYVIRMWVKGKAQYDRIEKNGSSVLLSKGVMEMAYWGLQPIGNFCVKAGVTPNAISWMSLFFGLLTMVAFIYGHFGTGGFLSAIASLLDSIDGMVARKTGTQSDSGEVLDAAIDRVVEFLFIAGLVIFYREIPWLMVISLLAMLGCFMVSYSTAKAEALQVDPPRGNMRRTERGVYLTLGAVLAPISIQSFELAGHYPVSIGYPMVFALCMVALFANVSAVQRLYAIAKAVGRK